MLQNHTAKAAIYARRSPEDRANRQNQFRGDGVSDSIETQILIKVHPQAAGAKGGNQDMSRTKGGSTQKCIWPWMRMVCQSESLLQKVPERIVKKLST